MPNGYEWRLFLPVPQALDAETLDHEVFRRYSAKWDEFRQEYSIPINVKSFKGETRSDIYYPMSSSMGLKRRGEGKLELKISDSDSSSSSRDLPGCLMWEKFKFKKFRKLQLFVAEHHPRMFNNLKSFEESAGIEMSKVRMKASASNGASVEITIIQPSSNMQPSKDEQTSDVKQKFVPVVENIKEATNNVQDRPWVSVCVEAPTVDMVIKQIKSDFPPTHVLWEFLDVCFAIGTHFMDSGSFDTMILPLCGGYPVFTLYLAKSLHRTFLVENIQLSNKLSYFKGSRLPQVRSPSPVKLRTFNFDKEDIILRGSDADDYGILKTVQNGEEESRKVEKPKGKKKEKKKKEEKKKNESRVTQNRDKDSGEMGNREGQVNQKNDLASAEKSDSEDSDTANCEPACCIS